MSDRHAPCAGERGFSADLVPKYPKSALDWYQKNSGSAAGRVHYRVGHVHCRASRVHYIPEEQLRFVECGPHAVFAQHVPDFRPGTNPPSVPDQYAPDMYQR
eukprot:2981006-Rhodomonas_salina.3